MARLPRLIIAGEAHHIIQRAAADGNAFRDLGDYRAFVEALRRASREEGVSLHAYVLLPDHFQLLATPGEASAIGRMMQALARFYVPAFNRRHGRAGALWQGRFRGGPVFGPGWLLDCMRYIEQTPLRACGQAADDYDWSSAACHIGCRTDSLLARLPSGSGYWPLGNTPFEREAAYRRLLAEPLEAEQLRRIEATTAKGWALGEGELLASAAGSGRPPAPRAPGRPKSKRAADDGDDVAPNIVHSVSLP